MYIMFKTSLGAKLLCMYARIRVLYTTTQYITIYTDEVNRVHFIIQMATLI